MWTLIKMFMGMFLRAWALATLWAWFILPLGAPRIGYAHALGISTLVSMFTHQFPSARQIGEDADWKRQPSNKSTVYIRDAVALILWPLLAVGAGFLYKRFM